MRHTNSIQKTTEWLYYIWQSHFQSKLFCIGVECNANTWDKTQIQEKYIHPKLYLKSPVLLSTIDRTVRKSTKVLKTQTQGANVSRTFHWDGKVNNLSCVSGTFAKWDYSVICKKFLNKFKMIHVQCILWEHLIELLLRTILDAVSLTPKFGK
jgi:hypothetical protein